MNLSPQERDKLLIYVAAQVARDRKNRGLKLNISEATALITAEMQRSRQTRPLFVGQPVVELTDVAVRILAALLEKGVRSEGHPVPDIQPVVDDQLRQKPGEGPVLRIEELVVARIQRPVGREKAVIADERIHAADLDVHPALGEDRQVGGHIQVAKIVAEPLVGHGIIDPAAGLAQRRVVPGEVANILADVKLVLFQLLLQH
jgi:urease gamma subunit